MIGVLGNPKGVKGLRSKLGAKEFSIKPKP